MYPATPPWLFWITVAVTVGPALSTVTEYGPSFPELPALSVSVNE